MARGKTFRALGVFSAGIKLAKLDFREPLMRRRIVELSDRQKKLASIIDHTLLKPEATEEEIFAVCKQAKDFGFYSVCVNGFWAKFAKHFLKDSPVKLCVVVGFPLGSSEITVKAFETAQAIAQGADEIDMVMNIGALKSENHELVFEDIKSVVQAASSRPVKVILETSLLDDFEIARACEIAVAAGAKFVKTSTGFSKGGATVDSVQLMRSIVGPQIGVKASGGIRSIEDAYRMIEAGATRLGTSQSIAIVTDTLSLDQVSQAY